MHPEKLQSSIDFYCENSAQIQKEHPRILVALRTIEHAMYTVHPLRMCIWSQYGSSFVVPELSQLEDQYEKWFSDCDINVTPTRESLDELSQISDRVSDLWLTASGTPTNSRAEPQDALEAAQNSLEQSQTTEKITSYLHTMALLIHSSRKSLEYLLHLFSLWVEIAETHSGDFLRESDTRLELTWCSMALYSAQLTWNELMKCPWTVAFVLHLLAEDPNTPRRHTNHRQERVLAERKDAEDAEDENEQDLDQVLCSDPTRPPRFASVFAAVDSTLVQDMLEGCFRLDSVMRRQHEAHGVITTVTGGTADGQNDRKLVHMIFASDKSKHRIDETEIVQIIRDYWKKEASFNTDTLAQEGFDLLSALAGTPELSQHHLHMNLDHPKVHPECILAQRWIDKPQRSNQAFPVIGLSRYACGTCKLFLEAVLEDVCEQPARFLKRMIPGTRDVFCLCMVPEKSSPDVKETVADGLLHKLSMQLRDDRVTAFLEERLNAAAGGESGVDRSGYRRGSDVFDSLDGITEPPLGIVEDEEQMTDI